MVYYTITDLGVQEAVHEAEAKEEDEETGIHPSSRTTLWLESRTHYE